MWLQQGGALCHTTRALLQETFPGRVISRRGDTKWPPRSCVLTPLDCRTLCARPCFLKTNIRQVIIDIPPNMCQKVVENYLKRINACNTTRGGNLNDVVFHT